jgi:hypothetical protein
VASLLQPADFCGFQVACFYACEDQHALLPIKPREGMIVLFPSYFYHRTIPFESAEERITLAFDFRF